MAGSLFDLRIDVNPTDANKRVWAWSVCLGEEVLEHGVAGTKRAAHAAAHEASLKHREPLETTGHGHKKGKKDE